MFNDELDVSEELLVSPELVAFTRNLESEGELLLGQGLGFELNEDLTISHLESLAHWLSEQWSDFRAFTTELNIDNVLSQLDSIMRHLQVSFEAFRQGEFEEGIEHLIQLTEVTVGLMNSFREYLSKGHLMDDLERVLIELATPYIHKGIDLNTSPT